MYLVRIKYGFLYLDIIFWIDGKTGLAMFLKLQRFGLWKSKCEKGSMNQVLFDLKNPYSCKQRCINS